MPNIARLETLLALVETLPPERIRMDIYAEKDFHPNKCKTASCLGGWACYAFPDRLSLDEQEGLFSDEPLLVVTNDIGLTGIDALADFFDLDDATEIFGQGIPNHKAVDNLRCFIERAKRESAQHISANTHSRDGRPSRGRRDHCKV